MKASVELQMIVRNGASSLARCIASAAPLVDRILVGNTGSFDHTGALANDLGAEVVSLSWQDDFAAARNQLLDRAQCDWILVLDADEMLDLGPWRAALPSLLTAPDIHAYGLWRWNYLDSASLSQALTQVQPNPGTFAYASAYAGFTASFHTRLFRRHPEIRFQHCVHEDVMGSVDRLGLERITAPLLIHHFGYVEGSPDQRRCKAEWYRELGLNRLRAAPHDFDSHLQVGISDLQQGRLKEAVYRLTRAADLCPNDRRAVLYLGICLVRLNRLEEAKTFLRKAEELGEKSTVLHDIFGDLHLCAGEYAEARAAYLRAAACMLDASKVLAKAGLAEVYLGNVKEGIAFIQAVVQQHPDSTHLRPLLSFARSIVEI